MSLIARDGSLLVGSDGKLTTNEDCCCDEPCVSVGLCECVTVVEGENGTNSPAHLQITIPTDTSSCQLFLSACGSVAGHDFAGTYFIACDDEVYATPDDSSGKREILVNVLTFVCTESGRDKYVREVLELFQWVIPGGGGFAGVILIFSTAEVWFTAGDDPETDPPELDIASKSRTYNYRWLAATHPDACGVSSQICSELELTSVALGSASDTFCSHSTAAADYAPSVVWIGTL